MDKKEILEWVKVIIISAVVALLITTFLVKPTVVRQDSMLPTLKEYDFLLLDRWTYRENLPQNGDIIVFKSSLKGGPIGTKKLLIKRVIAIPGDTLLIKEGKVYLNGEVLEENYTLEYHQEGHDYTDGKDYEGNEIVVPEGMVFAMGDNRFNSTDSRDAMVGLVLIDDIVGRAFLRLFPFNAIGQLK